MVDLELAANMTKFFTYLLGSIGVAYCVLLPPSMVVFDALLRKFEPEHAFCKDTKSSIKYLWKIVSNVDVRDTWGKRKLSDEEFDKKYAHLGLEKYLANRI